MKCHYKVLEIDTDADESQIKTAYRKLALKWHPDKNLDNIENAKEQFQFVQQAYEVLSDRQERAWYDKHRDQILYGKDYEDTALDVFKFFTTTCFKGHNDEPNGFFTIYREVFEKIAAEDCEHADEVESIQTPSFGCSDSDYDEVVGPFYAYWSTYSTKRSYAWLNPHNVQEVRDRRVFKLIEKENKKVRQKAKKDRNEEVRALVAFVRKRDVRVQLNSKRLEAKVIENRQKQETLSRQKRLERRQELIDEKPPAEWTKFENVENELKGIEKQLAETFGEVLSNDESENEFDNNLFCVACNKIFKSDKGYENHEFSKKHKQNVKMLKKTMMAQDIQDNIGNNQIAQPVENDDILNLSSESLDENNVQTTTQPETSQKKKIKKAKNVMQAVQDSDIDIDDKLVTEEDVKLINDADVDKNTNFNGISKKKSKRKSKNTNVKVDVKNSEEINLSHINDNLIEEKEKGNVKPKNREKNIPQTNNDINHICLTCKSNFPTKNKLFDHLKKTNHGVQLPSTSVPQNKKKLNK